MGAVTRQPVQPVHLIPAQHECKVCRDTYTAAATSVTVRPSLITARTARYRCSATLNSLIRECQASAEGIQTPWSRLGESNPGPTHYECVALPAELRRHMRHGPTG